MNLIWRNFGHIANLLVLVSYENKYHEKLSILDVCGDSWICLCRKTNKKEVSFGEFFFCYDNGVHNKGVERKKTVGIKMKKITIITYMLKRHLKVYVIKI